MATTYIYVDEKYSLGHAYFGLMAIGMFYNVASWVVSMIINDRLIKV